MAVELKIIRLIIPDLGAFKEALEGPFLILSDGTASTVVDGLREVREA